MPSFSLSNRRISFPVFAAAVLTVAMALFPPYVSLGGVEYASVFTGPEWARALGAEPLGARVYWPLLLAQLATVWTVAFGARWCGRSLVREERFHSNH